ncbi:TPA: gp53-like domain-containing protein [Klebsiella pneumoniae]
MEACTGSLGAQGWASFPLLGGRDLLVQWGAGRTPTGSLTYNCDITFPVSFPVTCLAVLNCSGVQTTNLDNNPRYRTLKQEVTFGMATQKGVQAQLMITDNTTQDGRFFYWMAIGY